MKHVRILAVAAFAGVLGGAALLGPAQQSVAEEAAAFDAKQTEAIQGIIKSYLIKNPQVMREALNEMRKVEEAELEKEKAKILSSLYKDETPLSSGNGKITLVEFFDYNCGPCRHAFTTLTKIMEKEKDFRVVFVDFPILSEESIVASQAAIAASKQGKYFALHRALMSQPGMVNEEKVLKAAADVGIDVEKLKKDMQDPEVNARIERNQKLATYWGLRGTPGFLIGDAVLPGMDQEFEQVITKAIAQVRKEGCKAC